MKHFARPLAAAAICLTALPALAETGGDDGVIAMCPSRTTDSACACAAKALQAEISPEEYAMYSRIGLDYVARQQEGAKMVEAWDSAVEAEAQARDMRRTDLMKRTNQLGQTFRKALKTCEG